MKAAIDSPRPNFRLQHTPARVVAVVCLDCQKTIGWTSIPQVVQLIEAAHSLKVHMNKAPTPE